MDFQFSQGRIPLLVSMPHVGTDIPDEIAARMTPQALQKADTDWHLRQLYDFLAPMQASVLSARWSRYTIDLNRPQEDSNLYPGQDTTGLLPLDTFHREALYLPGQAPNASNRQEVARRLQRYWAPYHQQLQSELARLLREHDAVVLWDAHSIASHVPRFFDGKLPDLNFGTADGTSCDAGLTEAVLQMALSQDQFSLALNGRFKGGHITRHYGRPAQRVQAIQLEMCQCLYMNEEAPFAYRPDLAAQVQPLLQQLLAAAVAWVRR